ncbi:SDR family NAD(P)-dependent oxidoreductase [Serratia entomophila]|uniref:SDR family NAD(P)-dependent oxidoreductase n=1 Tax=Serratia entomophila TaxID=42906 RepID=UPI00217A50FF|nr:SDR family NAD(P)-dependent oxidoreductase [Serratia entomophila]CAI0742137.1 3-oxoacyl-[acyl-carrier-protein] reductase FabG [Serratia entomophila]CAI0744031.1 3-oxoacyl-[acyl-carrier-protein] reductase FabG [Serratia entomophila]CAI1582167.1 3-oxoacyl-[acyl-carrier-protein] reductase FabG [Serratia entomophila]CAI1650177.1 3-oxoacyl-[acyl-carrier-protein] reductase FabG [Serratia entomophila]CAI1653549.1 3-oxoacyl-[acyl-carrier-protein] reductase FabG [Serratia entomophila]
MGDLAGKKVFITGAEQGIGRATAERLIQAGCDIYFHYHSDEAGPKALVTLAQARGQKAAYSYADLTSTEETARCVLAGAEFLGGIDILINNVGGIVGRKWLGEIDRPFWQTVIDVNLTTMLNVTQSALPFLKAAQDGASIVNLASLAGRSGGHSGSLVYSTTKGAVLTWTRSLAAELGEHGIRVNAVAPGLILGTRFHNRHTTQQSAEETIRAIPLGRAGTPDDVARVIAFLAAEYDGFVSGATIDINGGIFRM